MSPLLCVVQCQYQEAGSVSDCRERFTECHHCCVWFSVSIRRLVQCLTVGRGSLSVTTAVCGSVAVSGGWLSLMLSNSLCLHSLHI